MEQVFTWDLLLSVSVAALCCCGLLLFGLEVVVVELDCPAFGFELGGEPFSECDAAVSACAAGDADGGWLQGFDGGEVACELVGYAGLV
ncbi:hypothetical protein CIMIT_05670 [Corynebacterium imitans]|uniref:Uncharacterized protein n=1 Tax=Corynebacterium imitans TaxID=156978 RepID=A0A076NG70_9CORY|nr:hypothetical protein CIMIT_05670 [Corynebacterium imitans]